MIGQTWPQREEVQTLHRLLDMGLVKDFSVAIDGGAHVGTWAAVMAGYFERVLAFEPTPKTFGFLRENLAGLPNVETINAALLDGPGWVEVLMPRPKRRKLTSRYVRRSETGTIPCVTIDDLGLNACGLIKLDLEGAEGLALRGARETIRQFHPVMVVEISGLSVRFGHEPEDIHKGILAMGYREVMRMNVDRVYVRRQK